MPTVKRKIDLEVKALLRKARAAENEGVRDFLKVVNELRERVVLAVIDKEQISPSTVRQLREEIADIVNSYHNRFENILTETQRRMFVKGIQVIDVCLDTANIFRAVPYLTETTLQKAQEYGSTLITGLEDYVKTEINKHITLGLIGQKSSTELIKEIAGRLPTPSVFGTVYRRAMIIARTEANRILALSSQERMKQVGEKATDLMKTWSHSHLPNPRLNHQALHGIKIPFNEKFQLTGADGIRYEIDGPYDVTLPAGETINCRCVAIPSLKRFDEK